MSPCFSLPQVFRPVLCFLFLLLCFANCATAQTESQEPDTDALFAASPFDQWQHEGSRQQIPWQVRISRDKLSIHQRLITSIQVQVPGSELIKRSADQQLILFVQVSTGEGVSFRNHGLLDLADMKPEMKKSDLEFSWMAFALPGQYEISIALWDKKSGEHNFMRRLFHVDAYKDDPLPSMWRGLDAFEFWSTKRDGPDYIFHSDIDGRLNLPLKTKRPVRLQVLMDMSPTAEIFQGNYGYYNHYLGLALPMFKVFSQITPSNGSVELEALDLVQRRVPFAQNDGKDLDWPALRKALSPDNGPGVVSVKDLRKQQSPVFLREEIVRRLKADAAQERKQPERPLRVIVLIGGPMDFYVFPSLPAIETGYEEDCVIYYLQFELFEGKGLHGAAGNVEKMLKPLKVQTFQIRSADDARHALARMLEEVGKL